MHLDAPTHLLLLWILPLIVVLLLVALFIATSQVVAPFIYTLF